MSVPLIITPQDPRLDTLDFKPYHDSEERRVVPFLPRSDESQVMTIKTSWGAQLTANKGYLLIMDVDQPSDIWPVDPEIFSKSYAITRPGYCMKIVPTFLVPLTDLTYGNVDQLVTVQSLEGLETVRAGDFYLARGVSGEIWAYPKKRADEIMRPAE
ncbi:MAG: hypothetical protein H7Y59_07415 [Anaerolineales bacterium]|nr:hypothetical protein [Anaerolineales bacterium]